MIIYFCIIVLSWAPSIVNSTQPQLVGVAWQMLISAKDWCVIIGGPLACLIPDIFFNFIRMVFYPTPIDKVLYEQVLINPNYDHKESIMKQQKTTHMKKVQQSIMSEQRKRMLLQQKKSSFSQTDYLR